MKKILTIVLSFLLCVGAVGGTFALVKHLDGETNIETPADDSSNEPNNDSNNGSTDEKQEEQPNGENNSNAGNEEKQMVKAWQLCTENTQFSVGDQIVIAAQSSEFGLGNEQNSNNRSATLVKKTGEQMYVDENIQVITLEQGIVEDTFAFSVDWGFLYAASSSSNVLKTHALIDENSCWKLSIDSNGSAHIQSQGESTKNVLMYNSTSNLFSCYSSTQSAIVVYKLVETDIEVKSPVLKEDEILITGISQFRVGETYRFYLDKSQPNSEIYIVLNLIRGEGDFGGWYIEPGDTVQIDLPNIRIGISNVYEGKGYIYWGDQRLSVDAEVSSDGDYFEIVLDESIFSATGDNDKKPEICFELTRDTECLYIGSYGGAYLVAVNHDAA